MGYDVYIGSTLLGTVTGTTATVTGLTASTSYSFSVRAKDAAGNISPASNTVNVTTLAPPDTQAPTAPTNLTASNITQTTVDLSWGASTDNVGVVGYDVYQGATLLGTVTGTSASVTGLTASTTYSFSVRAKDAAGNISPSSNVVSVTTLGNTITYCTSQGNNSSDEWIQRVQLGSINNNSGNNGGYADFTNISTTLVKGVSNTITITPGWSGTRYREAYRVWIDYNQNGVFDSNELVYNRTRTNATSVSGSFTVPSTALNGPTRMRVSMKYNASPTACEIFAWGEVEDYTVVISTTGGQNYGQTSFDDSLAEFVIYPNPVKGSVLNLQLRDAVGTEIKVLNVLGQILKHQAFDTTLNVSQLTSGVYFVEVKTQDGQTLRKRFIKE